MAFTQKLLQASISIQSSGATVNIPAGLRMSATIIAVGTPENGITGNMDLAIWGLPLSLMNQLTTFGPNFSAKSENSIELFAGDAVSGMHLVYHGLIDFGYVDAQNMPLVSFRLNAIPGGHVWSMKPVPPISLSGPQDVAGMLSRLASQMGMNFENNGVNVKLTNPYYGGSPWQQAAQIARHASIDMIADRNTMAIMPAGQSRQGSPVLVSPQTGMVGYPLCQQSGVIVRTEFNPSIVPYGKIQIQSDITPACGIWGIIKLTYELDAFMPHGRWFQVIETTLTDQPQPP